MSNDKMAKPMVKGGKKAASPSPSKKRKFEGKGNHAKKGKKSFKPAKKKRVAVDPSKLKAERKAARGGENLESAKKLWERVLSKTISTKERSELVGQLWEIVSKRVEQYSTSHDLTRILQSIVKYGSEAMRGTILEHLKGKMIELSKGKYSCFLVIALLKNLKEEQVAKILREFTGQVRSIASHAIGARVLDVVLRSLEPSKLHYDLATELYGPEFLVFGKSAVNATSKSKNKKLKWRDLHRSLASDKLEAKVLKAVLAHLKQFVEKLSDKGILSLEFAHRLLHVYLTHCSKEDVQVVIPYVMNAFEHMVETQGGVVCIRLAVRAADAKQRKKLVRLFRGRVVGMCDHPYAYRVLLEVLNVVDDTVLLKKVILNELLSAPAESLVRMINGSCGTGRRILMHILKPGVPRYQTQVDRESLEDPRGLSTSKKLSADRQKEILSHSKDALVKLCDEHAKALYKDKKGCEFIAEVFETFASPSTRDALAEIVTTVAENGELRKMVEDRAAHYLFKRAVIAETQANAEGGDKTFGAKLQSAMSGFVKDVLFINRPSIIIAELLKHPAAKKAMREHVLPFEEKLAEGAKEGKPAAAATIVELLSSS